MRKRFWLMVLLLSCLAALSGCSWLFDPGITLSPTQGAVHTLVAIRGRGFGNTQGAGRVLFMGGPTGATYADVVSWSDTEIVFRVPMVSTPGGVPVETTVGVEIQEPDFCYESTSFTVVRGILFQSSRDGNWEIFVMNPDGSSQTNLSHFSGSDTSPCWSPDGTRVAFVSSSGPQEPDPMVMTADGSGRAALTDSPYHIDSDPRWSPDGSRIAFASEWDLTPEIWTVKPDGTDPIRLTDFNIIGVFSPCWSPDGSRIAFSASEGSSENDARIAVMSADGTGALYITAPGHGDDDPSWSPDGQWIVFARNRTDDEDSALMAVRPDGSELVRLTGSAFAWPVDPSWSPDGSAIVFSAVLEGETLYNVFLLDLEAEAVYRMTDGPGAHKSPFWGT